MRLSHKLALVFSLFGALIAGGILSQHTRQLRRETNEQVEKKAEIALSALSALVESQARTGRFLELGRSFQTLVRQAEVAAVVVKDRKGRRVVGRSESTEAAQRQTHPGTPLSLIPDGFYDVSVPVDLGPRGPGILHLSFDARSLQARLHAIDVEGVRSGVMIFLAITLAAWGFGAWVGIKVDRLLPNLEALPKDPERFKPMREGNSRDEVGRLVQAFNRLGQSLKQETLKRKDLEQEKKELSAMLVHDLKTPLTVICSGVTLLQEQYRDSVTQAGKRKSNGGRRRDDESNDRTFELLNLSTKRLQRMVEDVLQLARMEEIKGLKDASLVDLVEMARECAKDFGLIAKERGLTLELVLPEEPLTVLGEASLIRRVMDNLVHNAVEHTPAGLTVAISVNKEKDGRVRVSVSDSGPGVPQEARADIFRKFYQKGYKPHVGNVGLGLALCEKVVVRHGGTIAIEDALPSGACFYFILPSSPALTAA